MRHLILALLVIFSAACESNKESLPGSYKLDRTETEKLESRNYYSAKNFSPTEDRTIFKFTVSTYNSWDKDLFVGTVSLIPFTKDQKSFITYKLNIGDSEVSRTEAFIKEAGNIQQLEIIYKDLKADVAFVCRDTECKTIALSYRFSRYNINFRPYNTLYGSLWHMEEKEGSFKITTMFVLEGDSDLYNEMYKDPLYILKIPIDFPKLKKWQL